MRWHDRNNPVVDFFVNKRLDFLRIFLVHFFLQEKIITDTSTT